MAASAATATRASGTPTATTGVRPGGGAAAGAAANASNRNTINVDVVTQLPRGDYWQNGVVYDRGQRLALPSGYGYRDGGILADNNSLYLGADGRTGAVVDTRASCKGSAYQSTGANNKSWIGSIADSAIKACAGVITAAYNIVGDVTGSGNYQQC
jgi:hypothetical protein